MGDKQVIVAAFDLSEHSSYALKWTLEHFFSNEASKTLFDLVIVHAKASAVSVLGAATPGSTDVYALVEEDLKKQAERVTLKAMDLCKAHSVKDVKVDVMEGDARYVICEAVDKHKASFLVVGSHGYGALKRAILGSVSDYCSHNASCSVMIVKNNSKEKMSDEKK